MSKGISWKKTSRNVFYRGRPYKNLSKGFCKKNFQEAFYKGRQIRLYSVVEDFSEFRLYRGRCLRKFFTEQDLSANSLQKKIPQKNNYSLVNMKAFLGRYQSESILQKKILRRYSIEEDLSEDQKQKNTFQMVFDGKRHLRRSSIEDGVSEGFLWKSPVPCVS